MRWWLGHEGFAKNKCILSTRDEALIEASEDAEDVSPSQLPAWYGPGVPPFALWVCGSDELIDGRRLLRRFARGREPHVRVVHARVIEEYEHLDVLWAIDAIEKVGKEVKEVMWR